MALADEKSLLFLIRGMLMTHDSPPPVAQPAGLSLTHVLLIVGAAMLLTMVATFFIIKLLLFPPPFTPVTLNAKEEQIFAEKVAKLEGPAAVASPQASVQSPAQADNESLTPEKYSEGEAAREVFFTERELNAVLAKNTDLADKVAIDLAENMISVKLLIPLDPDLPLFGGRNFKARAGAEIAYREGRPVVKLVGLSLLGIPMPNSWLGGMKNVDLVQEFGSEQGFWKAFADGVESLSVVEGALRLTLKE
jgi:hypothetical protein